MRLILRQDVGCTMERRSKANMKWIVLGKTDKQSGCALAEITQCLSAQYVSAQPTGKRPHNQIN